MKFLNKCITHKNSARVYCIYVGRSMSESRRLKPRPYQQQCRSSIVERYKLNDSFDSVECCFDIVAVFGNNVAGFGNKVECCFDNVAGVDGALWEENSNVCRGDYIASRIGWSAAVGSVEALARTWPKRCSTAPFCEHAGTDANLIPTAQMFH